MWLLCVKWLSEELLLDLLDACFERRLDCDASFDGLAAVHDGCVVVAIEQLRNHVVRGAGVLLDQVHYYLTGQG